MSECAYCNSPVLAGVRFCCQSCELLSNWIANGEPPFKSKSLSEVSEKWRKFNLLDLANQFNYSTCPVYKKFRFYIEGLQCSSCVHLLEDFPRYCDQVISSRLNYSKRILEVEIKNTFMLGSLCEAIEQLGYHPTPLKEKSDYEAAKNTENASDLKRIGVAGAIAGNAMLFSVPIYAGLTGPLALTFKWISFFIFLPLLFYVAGPFYRKAWTSLLVRRINVDMMIVVALWAGFISSTYALILGTDELYFDSTASFIFLILLTRYLLKYHQDKLIHKNIFSDLFENDIYEVVEKNRRSYIAYSQIKPGQKIKLNQNQLLPCDSVLASSEADFDLSFLTGEAYPQKKHKGEVVLSGSRLLSPEALLKSSKEANESDLAVSLNKIDVQGVFKNKFQSLTDIIAHRLTLAVFGIAALFFVLTYQELGFEAFRRCLALITIACPCAVAFGTPLAHNMGLRSAIKNGFYLKSELVFEKLNKVKKVIFDKTGTLTSSQLNLAKTFPPEISEENKAIILGLEKHSLHPVAVSLKTIWSDSDVTNIPNVTEISGVGVAARYAEHDYRLSKSEVDQNLNTIQVDFSIDGRKTAYLYFEENIRAEARSVIDDFYKSDFDVMMLSGDRRQRALEVSRKIGIRPAYVFAEQSAESKKLIINTQNPCLFVGDGLNDIPALHEAYVSFAIKGPFESTLQVADIYAPQKNLRSVLEIFDLSKKIQQTVQANLLFAVLYNSVGGILALSGLINPLVAAVLMPISSFLITAHTAWRLR